MERDPEHDRDIPPDNGVRPPTAPPVRGDGIGAVGAGAGYSGQEYDSAGQAAWRERQETQSLPADGGVHGSGKGAGGGSEGEDFDSGTPGGASPEGVG